MLPSFFREPLISNCPVCGEDLGKYDKINDMIHMTLCFDEGTGNQIMTGGFLTDKQASYGQDASFIDDSFLLLNIMQM